MIRVLLLRSWTADKESIRVAIARTGLPVIVTRVDFPAALHAALSRERFDLVVVDPEVGVSRDVIDEALRAYDLKLPIVILESLETLGDQVKRVVEAQRC